jgi:hydroxyacyl-ACP dehydratase HTD2-like protein with hotdog domain
MSIDVQAISEKFVGHQFDEAQFEIKADALVEYAEACGEIAPCFIDANDSDFQAVPNYPARFHGRRQLPEGFPVKLNRSFDAGKAVEVRGPIRAGDTVTAKSRIHEIYEKTGRSGGMMFVVHRMEFFNQRDELVSVVDWRLVQRMDSF